MRRLVMAAGALMLSACSHTYSLPMDPALTVKERGASLFVDRDGSVYPPDWRTAYPEAAEVASLRRALRPEDVAAFEARQNALLDQIAAAADGKNRVFVLIHGFRDPQPGSDESFAMVREAIQLRPRDAVIDFHWDGLQSSDLAVGNIWFEAAGNSQLAGLRALRPLLARLRDKHILLISHSRGASVILSAISNPSFAPERARQERAAFPELPLAGPALPANNNRIDAIFLAPAVGCPDFWRPAEEWVEGGDKLRDLPHLRSIHYTTNPSDWVLEKGLRAIPLLSGSFNATNLGYAPRVGGTLSERYPILHPHPISGIDHGFGGYARHPALREMLAELGVETKPLPADYTPPPELPQVTSRGRCQTVVTAKDMQDRVDPPR